MSQPTNWRGPLCWGQHWSWLLDAAPTKRHSPAAAAVVELYVRVPSGTTVTTVRQAVDLVVLRHQALRSTFPVGSDGAPGQCLHPSWTPPLTTVELENGVDGEALDVLRSALDPVLDVTADPPVQVVVGAVEAAPAVLLVSIHIVAVDGFSYEVIWNELRTFITELNDGRDPDPPAVAWQPADQAAHEALPHMQERNRRNLDSWSRYFASAPPTALPIYWHNILGYIEGTHSLLTSAELGSACRRIARRCGSAEVTVLLTALALIYGTWSGQRQTVIGETTAGRYLPQMRSGVGRYKAVTQLVVDLDPALAFDTLVRKTHAASLRARHRSICQEGEIAMAMSRESVRQGSRIEFPPQFNYHPYLALTGDSQFGTPGTGDSGTSGTLIEERDDQVPQPLPYVDAWPLPGGGLRMLLKCSKLLLPHGGGDVLRTLDGLLRAVADDGARPVSRLARSIRLPRFWSGQKWLSRRSSWFSLSDTEGLLQEHPGVRSARVVVAAQDQVVAYVVARHDRLRADDVHDYLRDQASTWPTVLLPDHYVVRRRHAPQPLTTGSGRVPSRRTPRTPEEALLVGVFTAVHPGLTPDLSASYAEAGGEFLRIPATIRRLAEAGYGALTYQDLLGMATLGRLASRLRATGTGQPAPEVSGR